MPVYNYRIPLKGRSQPRPKVNRRFGGVFFSKSFTKWREDFKHQLETYFDYEPETAHPQAPITVEIRFYNLNKNSDLDNAAKPINDMLQEIPGLFEDDKQIYKLIVERSPEKLKIPMTEICVSWQEDQE